MKYLFTLCLTALPFSALAEAYTRPTPQAQSATAEHWFALASIMLIVALIVVGRLVARR